MGKIPKKESQSQLLALFWAIGVTAVAVLLGLSFPEWAVLFVAIVGAASFTGAFHMHGWFHAPLPIGQVVKGPILVCAIWGCMGLLAWAVWPTVEISPA